MQTSTAGSGKATVIATGFFSLFSLIGILFYGLPFFYDFWVRDLGWSRATVTSGNAIAKISVGLFGFMAGWFIDHAGPRRLMLIGILCGGIALIGLGNLSSLWQFYFFYLFSAAAYMLGGPLPNQILITRWFRASRGKAMAIAYIGVGIGGMLVPQLSRWLHAKYGWQVALMILGVLIMVVAFPFALAVKENPPNQALAEIQAPPRISPAGLFRLRPFVLLTIGSMCSIAAVSGTVQNLKLFFSLDLHYSQSYAANIISLVLLSSIIGRLLMGWLADRFPKKKVMVLIYVLAAVAISLLYFVTVPGVQYLFAIVFGIALGGDYMIIPLMAAELFELKLLGRVMGLVLTFDGFSDALSPLLIGWIRDLTGSYTSGFAVLIVLAVIGIIAVSLLPSKKPAP